MEDQRAEMIQLYEIAALEKDEAALVRRNYSKKSMHYESRSPLVLLKEERVLPHHHNMTENPHTPPAAQGVIGRRPAMAMSTPRI